MAQIYANANKQKPKSILSWVHYILEKLISKAIKILSKSS